MGSAGRWGGVLFVAAVAIGLAATIAALVVLPALPGLDHPAVATAGLALTLAGSTLTVATQTTMGTAWRVGVGVDTGERTRLVTGGVFGHVAIRSSPPPPAWRCWHPTRSR